MCCQKPTPSDLQHTMTHVYHDIDPSIYFVVSLVAVRLNYKLVTKPYMYLIITFVYTGVCLFTGEVAWVSLVPCPFWGVGISGTRFLRGGTHGAFKRMGAFFSTACAVIFTKSSKSKFFSDILQARALPLHSFCEPHYI